MVIEFREWLIVNHKIRLIFFNDQLLINLLCIYIMLTFRAFIGGLTFGSLMSISIFPSREEKMFKPT